MMPEGFFSQYLRDIIEAINFKCIDDEETAANAAVKKSPLKMVVSDNMHNALDPISLDSTTDRDMHDLQTDVAFNELFDGLLNGDQSKLSNG